MMAFLFLLLIIALFLAWGGQRNQSLSVLLLTLLLCTVLFIHHITSQLNLNL